MKLPVLPKQIVRGAYWQPPRAAALWARRTGPIQPKVYGFPAIIKVLINRRRRKGVTWAMRNIESARGEHRRRDASVPSAGKGVKRTIIVHVQNSGVVTGFFAKDRRQL